MEKESSCVVTSVLLRLNTSGNYTGDGIQTLEKVGISIMVMWDSRERKIFCYIVYYYITPADSTACHGYGNT